MIRIYVTVKAGVKKLRLTEEKEVTELSETAVNAQHPDTQSVYDLVLHLERL